MIMRKAKIKKVERYLFWHCKHKYEAGLAVSSILGVLIDLKPACNCIFDEQKTRKFNLRRFAAILEELELKVIFERKIIEGGYLLSLYISKSQKKAERLKELFGDLNRYNFGDKERKEINAEIGKLLGYPKTAVDYYVRNVESGDLSKSHKDRILRYFYYAHSDKYQDQEFKEYDIVLNRALEKYSSRSAKEIRRKYPQKRWLD